MRRLLVGLSVLVSIVALVAAAGATTLLRMDLGEVVQAADRIVIGTIAATEVVELDGKKWTRVTVAPDRESGLLKGDFSEPVTFLTLSVVDTSGPVPYAVTVPGEPLPLAGTPTVIATKAVPELGNEHTIVGFSQGYFQIVNGPQGPTVLRDLSGVKLAGKGGIEQGAVSGQPLDAFVAEIRGYLKDLPSAADKR